MIQLRRKIKEGKREGGRVNFTTLHFLFNALKRLVTKEIHLKGFEITDVKISRLIPLKNNIIAKVFQYENRVVISRKQ